jgi:hypothetical protein
VTTEVTVPDERDCYGPIVLGHLIGVRVRFPFAGVPPLPPQLAAVLDPCLRQHVADAWVATSRLDAAIRVIRLFLFAAEFGVGIDDQTHRDITAVFPELKHLQAVLDALSALATNERPAAEGYDWSTFPEQGCWDVLTTMPGLVGREAHALHAIGVRSPSFSGSDEPGWGRMARVMGPDCDLTVRPPVVYIRRDVSPELDRLHEEVIEFRPLLRTAPAVALLIPKQSAAAAAEPPSSPLSIDVTNPAKPRARLGGDVFHVTPAAAAFLAGLLHHHPRTVAFGTLREEDARGELRGVNVTDLYNALPRELQAVVGRKPGGGCWLQFG